MPKFAIVTLTAVTLSLSAGAATAKAVHGSNKPVSAITMQSAGQLSADASHTIETHGEPLSLIFLGSLFVGSAMFFSSRRSNA